jgi:hypothetical protein
MVGKMTNNKYNGWTNWETWNWNLHNDDAFTDDAQQCYNDAESDETFSKEQRAILDLADYMKSIAEADAEELTMVLSQNHIKQSFFIDAMNASLSEINFFEIAENYMSDVDKTEAE